MIEHSILPPSSAARRVACSGSRELEARYPQKDSPSAREGEAAHWVASETLVAAQKYSGFKPILPDIASNAPNGEPITNEMIEGGHLYADTILLKIPYTIPLHIEERIDIPTIHSACWGTPDCWSLYDNKLYIWDYKYGHGFVDVFENWQLIEYAAGILDHLNLLNDVNTTVHFCIVQPRNYSQDPVRVWEIRADKLEKYFTILRAKENEAMQPKALCQPNPECNYCLGRHACRALQQAALTAVDLAYENTPWELPTESVGNELRYLKRAAELLDARITGLSEQVTILLRKGERVPFFRLENTAGRERWKVDAKEVIALGELFDIDVKKASEVVTPRQAIKLGLSEELISTYIERTKSALKLTSDDDSFGRKIFGDKE